MKRILFFYVLVFTSALCSNVLRAQGEGVHLSISEADSTKQELIFTITNNTDQVITAGLFNKSNSNKIIIKNANGIVVSYTFTHNILPNKIEIRPKETISWRYDLNEFFYPKTGFPRRFVNQKGEYKIFWKFNDLESAPYYFNFD